MLWMLLAMSAPAAELVVDAQVPAEVWVSGQLVGQLFQPAELRLDVAEGPLPLTILVGGEPTKLDVAAPALVIVGRNGISTGQHDPAAPVPAVGPVPVEFRSTGQEDLLLVLDKERRTVDVGQVLTIELTPGRHPISLRSRDGTMLYARGSLEVGGEGLVVQLSPGRMPEVIGKSGSYHPGS